MRLGGNGTLSSMKTAQLLTACALSFVFIVNGQTPEVAEASIAALQEAMASGKATSKALVEAYLARIAAFDKQGPALNAVITLNPNALREAEALDRERREKGPRGPLHGIPVLVKDNYGTAGLQTTAGTMALLGFVPSADAFQVKKLREAGAVILGKTNLHELASGITTVGSAFGQTRNPYDPSRNPGGSSGGTGAAVAASFAAAGMGSDTCGSIRIPAAVNNLYGLRPTKGLSSIAGIVPLSTTQDTGGPLARIVTDLAVVLDATAGEDPADPATHLPPGQARPKFAEALKRGTLKDARIGILEPLFGDANDEADVIRIVRAAIEEMKAAGAVTVPVAMPDLLTALDGSSVINAEFKEDLAAYLAGQPNAPVKSLDQILSGGLYHSALETAFNLRVASKGRDSYEYRIALAKRTAMQQAILKLMDEQKLDALVYPTLRRRPAVINAPQGGATCQLSATTGFPAITMPAGFTSDGLPVGVELLGRAMDDAKLVGYAYDHEQATHHRRAPARTPALAGLTKISWQSSAKSGAGAVSGSFTFDPSTSELAWTVTAAGFGAGELLGATIHRAGPKTENGPVIAVLANQAFQNVSGKMLLSDPDRQNLMSGKLYLRTGGRTGVRMVVRAAPAK